MVGRLPVGSTIASYLKAGGQEKSNNYPAGWSLAPSFIPKQGGYPPWQLGQQQSWQGCT